MANPQKPLKIGYSKRLPEVGFDSNLSLNLS